MSTPCPLKGRRPPPVFDHPLHEGDRRQATAVQFVPLSEGVPEGRGRLFPGADDGAPARGRLSGEAPPEPLPAHRKLYNRNLQPTANKLRKRMTKAEACLWKYVLRAGKMKGYTFNRQRPVLRYIADFMCKPLGLIIEVDGSSHDDPKTQKHDAFRQRELEMCGFTVIRFCNDEILGAIDSVRNEIERNIEKIVSSDLLTGRKRVEYSEKTTEAS